MPFWTREKAKALKLPAVYNNIPYTERWKYRDAYCIRQQGLCYYCKSSLSENPPDHIQAKRIDWDLFPNGFTQHPLHLHHSRTTGLTLGVVHALCNAVLWQYEGE